MRDWVARVEPTAYGELGLLPWQFGRLTPREIRLRLEGWQRAEERHANRVIWMVQHNFKDALVPRDILRGRPAPPKG